MRYDNIIVSAHTVTTMNIYEKLQSSKNVLNKVILVICFIQCASITFTSMVMFAILSITLFLSIFARGMVSVLSGLTPRFFEKMYDALAAGKVL